MYRFIICTLVTLMVGSFGQAQLARQMRTDGISASTNNFFSEMRKKKDLEVGILETVGTPYIDESFKPCEVFYNDELVGNFYYRHNALNDEIEIKDTQIPSEEISSLATMRELRLKDLDNGQELSLTTYENKDEETRNGYMYQLQEGSKYNLLFKKNVKFTQGTNPVNSLTRPTPNKFSQFIEYYYFAPDGKVAQYIPTRKSQFIRTFDKSVQDKLKEFMKTEDINIKREEDLIRVFQFLNQQA